MHKCKSSRGIFIILIGEVVPLPDGNSPVHPRRLPPGHGGRALPGRSLTLGTHDHLGTVAGIQGMSSRLSCVTLPPERLEIFVGGGRCKMSCVSQKNLGSGSVCVLAATNVGPSQREMFASLPSVGSWGEGQEGKLQMKNGG